jgi:hypothetical protein
MIGPAPTLPPERRDAPIKLDLPPTVKMGAHPLVPFLGNYGDGVDGAPIGIDVPRWSLSQPI